ILVPISALLIQWFSTRKLFIASIIFSIIGILLGGLSPSFSVLLMGRILQAVGTGLLLPLMYNIVLVIVPPQKRGTAMGFIGFVMMSSLAIGPAVSGFITESLGYQWLFWLALPFFIVALLCGIFFMQNVSTITKPNIDFWSILLSTIGFGGIVYGFSSEIGRASCRERV